MGTPMWYEFPLIEGDTGRAVLIVQRKLGLLPTGEMDAATVLTLRGFQRGAGLPVTGAVDELTARELGEQEGFGLLPSWWQEPGIGPDSPHFAHVLELLDVDSIDGLKRFQGNHHLPPTGVVDETTARLLAGLEVESWGITLPLHRSAVMSQSESCGRSCRRPSESCCSTSEE